MPGQEMLNTVMRAVADRHNSVAGQRMRRKKVITASRLRDLAPWPRPKQRRLRLVDRDRATAYGSSPRVSPVGSVGSARRRRRREARLAGEEAAYLGVVTLRRTRGGRTADVVVVLDLTLL